jgi:hypothetical protein
VLVFSDAEVIRMAREEFVPVAADDWYQRRREDEEGKFFRSVADQGPRKGEGGSTRQGIYVFTAAGKLLAYRNHHDPAVMSGVLRKALGDWRKLPEAQRNPGAVAVGPAGKTDATYDRKPPAGGLIVNVHTRILDRKGEGDFCVGTSRRMGGDMAARDHLWLTEAEWRGLIPANARAGDKVTVPAAVLYRMARFHLWDNTRGEPPAWNHNQIRRANLTLTVETVNDSAVTLKLEGSVLLATDADPKRAQRGFDASLLGRIRYDVKKNVIDRFDVVALGEHWGDSTYTRGARPGRTPLGVAFELARGDAGADQVPPQGSRWLQGYLRADKE